jgi:hypothetical protein
MRQLLAVSAAAAVAMAGALILGEYELRGPMALVAGAVFGAAVAEVLLAVGADARLPMLVVAGLLTAGGLVWAVWISTGRNLRFASNSAWTGVALGAVLAPVWLRTAAQRGRRSSSGS